MHQCARGALFFPRSLGYRVGPPGCGHHTRGCDTTARRAVTWRGASVVSHQLAWYRWSGLSTRICSFNLFKIYRISEWGNVAMVRRPPDPQWFHCTTDDKNKSSVENTIILAEPWAPLRIPKPLRRKRSPQNDWNPVKVAPVKTERTKTAGYSGESPFTQLGPSALSVATQAALGKIRSAPSYSSSRSPSRSQRFGPVPVLYRCDKRTCVELCDRAEPVFHVVISVTGIYTGTEPFKIFLPGQNKINTEQCTYTEPIICSLETVSSFKNRACGARTVYIIVSQKRKQYTKPCINRVVYLGTGNIYLQFLGQQVHN